MELFVWIKLASRRCSVKAYLWNSFVENKKRQKRSALQIVCVCVYSFTLVNILVGVSVLSVLSIEEVTPSLQCYPGHLHPPNGELCVQRDTLTLYT